MIPRADILCIVLAHGGVSATVGRHAPHWSAVAGEVVVFSPWDDPLPGDWPGQTLAGQQAGTGLRYLPHGISSRYGADNNHRVREAIRYAHCRARPLTLLCEYDALVLGAGVPDAARPPAGGIAGAAYDEPAEWGGVRFSAPRYYHYPLLMDRAAVAALLAALDVMPPDAEGGYSDRTLAAAIVSAKLPALDLRAAGLAWSKDTIEPRHLPRARRAAAQGARFFHGVKHGVILEALLREVFA